MICIVLQAFFNIIGADVGAAGGDLAAVMFLVYLLVMGAVDSVIAAAAFLKTLASLFFILGGDSPIKDLLEEISRNLSAALDAFFLVTME